MTALDAIDQTAPPRRVLVTGGAGFIGSHVVDALLAQGREPVVLDDFSGGDMANLPAGIEIIRADIADPAVADQIADLKPDGIIHAAAQVSVPTSMAHPARDREINLLGTAHVIEGARRAGGCRVVFVSTGGGIYGDTEGSATEASLPRPKAFYSIHKYAAEQYLKLSGLPYAIARLANVYGSRQRSGIDGAVVAIFADQLARREPVTIFGNGRQARDFVHVADVTTALLAMLDADRDGLWNVGTGTAVTINTLLMLMECAIAPVVALHRAPPRPGDVLNSCLAVTRIAVELGWRPTLSLEDGLRRTQSESSGSVGP